MASRLKLVLQALRDGWLILGVLAALLLLLEVGYRVQAAVRSSARPALTGTPPGSPLAEVEWGAAYIAEHDSTFALNWTPYVYFRRQPYSGRFITVDSLGRRLTPPPSGTPVGARVLFLGGSTMWGSYLRDGHTIPAHVARHLDTVASGPSVEVLNLGEAGYVFTQEVIALSLALRDGVRPDVVVFYDGINDVASVVQQGTAGIPQNEFNRAAEFAWGRDLNPPQPSARADLKAMGRLTVAAASLSDLVRRLRGRPAIVHADQLPPDSAARAAATTNVSAARIVEALAAQYRFKPIFVWQPTLHPTAKPPTPSRRTC